MRDLALLLLVALALEWFLTRGAAHGPAPSINALTLNGEPVSLKQLAGSPAAIHFWGTWCPVCKAEEGNIESIARSDFPLITVAMQSGRDDEIAAYLRKRGLDFPVINDRDGGLSHRYGVQGVPATFILDGKGNIRFVTRGYTTSAGLYARLWLAGLMSD